MTRADYPVAFDVFLILLSFVLPFVVIAIKRGWRTRDFLISIILSLLFHFPAVVYSIYIVLKYPQPEIDRTRRGYINVDEEQAIGTSGDSPSHRHHHSHDRSHHQEAASSSLIEIETPPEYTASAHPVMDNKVQQP